MPYNLHFFVYTMRICVIEELGSCWSPVYSVRVMEILLLEGMTAELVTGLSEPEPPLAEK